MLQTIQTALDSAADPALKVPARYADAVLEAIEAAGMLPPETLIDKRSCAYDVTGDVMFDEVVTVRTNEWEPENEN